MLKDAIREGKFYMQVIMGIIWVVLIIVNLVIFHSLFTVIYSDLGRGLMKEFVYAFVGASIEISLFEKFGAIIIGIIVVIAIIMGIASAFKK